MPINKNDIINFGKNFNKIDLKHFGRDFGKNYIKFQFIIDHLSSSHRTAILGGVLCVILIPWFFLVYMPQVDSVAQAEQQVGDLTNQKNLLDTQRTMIVTLSKSHEITALIGKYKKLQSDVAVVNQQLLQYHDNYIDEKTLSKLVYSTILSEASDISVDTFTIIANEAPQSPAASSSSSSPAPTTPATKTPEKTSLQIIEDSLILPVTTRYSLVLRGNYFSIMNCLKRLEALKWDLFWDKLTYSVDHYPQAIATIEFFTLKVPKKQDKPAATPAAAQGAAT